MNTSSDLRYLALAFHRRLPDRLKQYLIARGVAEPLIHRHRLGWNGDRITIPITNRDRQVVFFKMARDPENGWDNPEMISTSAVQVELYGWERVLHKREQLVICENEFDRLILEAHEIAAVCSTGGTATFLPAWARHFQDIPRVLICFNNDSAGRGSAARVAKLIPHSRIIHLPQDLPAGSDVADFFVRRGRTREDFDRIAGAGSPGKGAPESALCAGQPMPASEPATNVDQVRARVRIENLIGRYVSLRPKGSQRVGQCPFHPDDNESFTVYPETQSFHCFGCQVHGDAVSFLIRIEKLGFPEALAFLLDISNDHGR